MKKHIFDKIEETGIVSIIRGISESKIFETVDALLDGGIKALEVTFDTPGAARMLEMIKGRYADKITIGAGTILDPETARTAMLSGADFVLSPSLNTKMIEICNRYGRLAVPGVLTPTEIVTALEAGAQIVKLFPAGSMGAGYLKDVKGPLKQAEIMAVGGISLANAEEFIKNGAIALGIGSELVNSKLVTTGSYDLITSNASAFIEKVKKARTGK